MELLAELAVEEVPLPVTLLDGEVLYAGAINPLRVVAAVAEARHHKLTHSSE